MAGDMEAINSLGHQIRVHVTAGDRALVEAEEHYKAAGIILLEAKARVKRTRGLTWAAFVVGTCHISVRRADELIQIADGRTTLEEMRERKAESARRFRARQNTESTAQFAILREPSGNSEHLDLVVHISRQLRQASLLQLQAIQLILGAAA